MNIKHLEYNPHKVSGQSEDKWHYKPNADAKQYTASGEHEQLKNDNQDVD